MDNNLSKSEISKKFIAWRKDWNLFAKEVFKVTLDKEQQQILHSVQYERMTTVASGTARGKDFVAAVSALCFLYLTPVWDSKGEMIENTKVAMTAPSDRQVGNIVYPEISRLFKRAKFLPGRQVGYDIRTDNEEWFLTGFKADETQTEVWTGFHAVHTMFIVTEASGMPDKVFEAIEGNLQGESRILIVFNPNRSVGYAAKTHNDVIEQKRWKQFRLNSLTAPNVITKQKTIPGQVDYEWVKDKVRLWCRPVPKDDNGKIQVSKTIEGDFKFENIWYRPNDLFRVKVLGMFPRVSEDVLIPFEWIRLAWERWKEQEENNWVITKPLRLGADAAGMGRDSNTMCHRFGDYVEKFTQFNSAGKALHMQFAGNIVSVMENNNNDFLGVHPKVFVDTIGEGGGVYSRLIELSENDDFDFLKDNVFSVKHSEAPEHEGIVLKDKTGQYSFMNMRAYLLWAVRDWLSPEFDSKAALPEDYELAEEMTQTTWKFKSNGKIQIESKEDIKERIKHSPDKFDALASTFYPVEDFDINLQTKKSKASDYFPM